MSRRRRLNRHHAVKKKHGCFKFRTWFDESPVHLRLTSTMWNTASWCLQWHLRSGDHTFQASSANSICCPALYGPKQTGPGQPATKIHPATSARSITADIALLYGQYSLTTLGDRITNIITGRSSRRLDLFLFDFKWLLTGLQLCSG